MAKSFLYIFAGTLAFSMDVKVRAQSDKLFSDPARCTLEQVGCAVQADNDQTVITYMNQNNQLGLARGAIISSVSTGHLRLIQGLIRVRAMDELAVAVPQAEIEVSTGGEVLLDKDQLELAIIVIKGEVRIFAKGGEKIVVTQGKTQRVGPLDSQGHARLEPYYASPWSGTMKAWWRTFSGNKTEFIKLVKLTLPDWKRSTEETSQVHLGLARRHIAEVQKKRDEALKRRQSRAREESQLRQLFRQMTYVEGVERPTLIEPEAESLSP